MKFSIIGTGFILPSHIEAIRDIKGKIIDVVNTSKDLNSWKKMIRETDANCIVILAPNYLHNEMIQESLKNNKVVLCEKPLVIKEEDGELLQSEENLFTVLQLRHHPLINDIKRNIREKNEIEMDISVYRDEDYYNSWKGQKEKSGGVLFNLGVHYFDILLYLFGEAKEIKTKEINDKTGQGLIIGDNYICNWKVSTDAKKEEQRRVFKINGIDYNFSSRDNLSFENLHRFVYQDLLKGEGVTPKEALRSIRLIKRINNSFNEKNS